MKKSISLENQQVKVWKNPQGNIVLQFGEVFTSFSPDENSKRNHDHIFNQLEKLLEDK